ncbi:YcxB family protein [Crateriforma conspicua]|nr:YcxB family protein [Crateriforma conspicua]
MDSLTSRPADRGRSSIMENVNPYDPPLPASTDTDGESPHAGNAVTATFVFSPEHLIETLTRYRSQHLGRRIWRWVRYAAALVFLLVTVVGLFIPQYVASIFMLALAVFMFFPHKVDDFLARRNFHKSPHCNTLQTVRFTDEGLHSSSENQDSTLKWTAFSRAVVFNDGVLIFQGPKMVHWFPDNILDRKGDAESLRNLVESNLTTNHAVHRSGVNAIPDG